VGVQRRGTKSTADVIGWGLLIEPSARNGKPYRFSAMTSCQEGDGSHAVLALN
jgi:hypothetical protein